MTKPLALAEVQRFARQIALPEMGVTGQARLGQARALVVAQGGLAHAGAAAARDYLLAAGMAAVSVIEPAGADPTPWLAALQGVQVALRFGFDDDPFLTAAVRLGCPAVLARAQAQAVDLLSFRRHGPCPHRELTASRRPAGLAELGQGAQAVLAGTLAAAEALLLLAAPGEPRARLLRLPLSEDPPTTTVLPWAPECFVCGGQHQSASFT